jgi:hypothetical protein
MTAVLWREWLNSLRLTSQRTGRASNSSSNNRKNVQRLDSKAIVIIEQLSILRYPVAELTNSSCNDMLDIWSSLLQRCLVTDSVCSKFSTLAIALLTYQKFVLSGDVASNLGHVYLRMLADCELGRAAQCDLLRCVGITLFERASMLRAPIGDNLTRKLSELSQWTLGVTDARTCAALIALGNFCAHASTRISRVVYVHVLGTLASNVLAFSRVDLLRLLTDERATTRVVRLTLRALHLVLPECGTASDANFDALTGPLMTVALSSVVSARSTGETGIRQRNAAPDSEDDDDDDEGDDGADQLDVGTQRAAVTARLPASERVRLPPLLVVGTSAKLGDVSSESESSGSERTGDNTADHARRQIARVRSLSFAASTLLARRAPRRFFAHWKASREIVGVVADRSEVRRVRAAAARLLASMLDDSRPLLVALTGGTPATAPSRLAFEPFSAWLATLLARLHTQIGDALAACDDSALKGIVLKAIGALALNTPYSALGSADVGLRASLLRACMRTFVDVDDAVADDAVARLSSDVAVAAVGAVLLAGDSACAATARALETETAALIIARADRAVHLGRLTRAAALLEALSGGAQLVSAM